MIRLWYYIWYKPRFSLTHLSVRIKFCVGLSKPKVFKKLLYLPISYYHVNNVTSFELAAKYIREALIK